MTKKKLLLSIHNQCEVLQETISVHYRPCVEIEKEVTHLLTLLAVYIVKNL